MDAAGLFAQNLPGVYSWISPNVHPDTTPEFQHWRALFYPVVLLRLL